MKFIARLINQDFTDIESHLDFNSEIDLFYNLNHIHFETDSEEHYPDLNQDALNTSYFDYYQILKSISKGQNIADLGAGIGRGSLLSCLLGFKNCFSIEIVTKRCDQLKSALSQFESEHLAVQADLVRSPIPDCDNYYLYFPKSIALYHILRKLFKKNGLVYVCEAHGDTIPFLELFPDQLECIKEIPLAMPRHYPFIKIYKIKSATLENNIHTNFQSWYARNFDSDLNIIAKFNHIGMKKEVSLLMPIKNYDLVIYKSQLALQHRVSNRRYVLYQEIKISHTSNAKLTPLLIESLNIGSKVFCVDRKVFIEGRDGTLVMTEWDSLALGSLDPT